MNKNPLLFKCKTVNGNQDDNIMKMNRDVLIDKLNKNYTLFIEYINSLTDDEFVVSLNDKWTAGQQLDHILRSVKPLTQILNSKSIIEDIFGMTERPSLSYEEIVNNYKIELEKGGKATGKFIPEKINSNQKNDLTKALADNLKTLIQNLIDYTDKELDSLLLPHPLLGNLTIREMIYFTIYHVGHHHEKTTQNFKNNKTND